MYLFIFTGNRAIILADSLTRSFAPIIEADVITRPGASPAKLLDFLKQKPGLLANYSVIVLHVGTTWLSAKEEWALYLRQVNGNISQDEYNNALKSMNPPPAVGPATTFREEYSSLITHIRSINDTAIILVSSIIPRPWDHGRRHLVRVSYNNLLQKFNEPSEGIFFIHSYKPFIRPPKTLKGHLFNPDGIHLSQHGSAVLRSYFCEKIDKAKRGRLK